MGVASVAEPVAVFAELAVVERRQDLGDGLLDHPIQHGGHSEGPLAPVGFRDEHPAHRRRMIGSFPELGADALPVFAGKRREVIDGHPINARRAFVRLHLFPGKVQIRAIQHLLEQRVRIDWSRSMLLRRPG